MDKVQKGAIDSEVTQETSRKTEYLPPDEKVFEELAKRFCSTLSEGGDLTANTEVVVGLAEFLTVIARLAAKSLSRNKTKTVEVNQAPKKAT